MAEAPSHFLSYEMKALASVTAMECGEETKTMIKYAKKREMPDKDAQDKLKACWAKTYTNSMQACKEDFEKLMVCLENNERRSLKCADLRKMYEENYVKNVILK